MPEITDILNIIQTVIILVFSLVIHENAHARVAYYLGDPTAKYQGRFSLNPLKHMQLAGLLLPLILSLLKLPPIGFAKPVIVNTENFKYPAFYNILVAIAGPLSNLLMAFIAIALYNKLTFLDDFGISGGNEFLLKFSVINLVLFLFNSLPIPPLDGSRIYTSFISKNNTNLLIIIEAVGFGIVILLLRNDRFSEYFTFILQSIITSMAQLVG